jgi:hypothetical protein
MKSPPIGSGSKALSALGVVRPSRPVVLIRYAAAAEVPGGLLPSGAGRRRQVGRRFREGVGRAK